MSESPRDICMIGGGIIGSWAALHLVEAGVKVTIVERFPHPRGSSQGQSRAFRFLGDDDTDRLEYSLDRWLALERERDETLFVRTGLLNFGPEGDPFLERSMAIVREGDRPCEWLTREVIAERFPSLRHPEEWGAVWDPNGGILLAHRCLAAVRSRFLDLGGRIVTARAESVEPLSGGGVRVGLRSHETARPSERVVDKVVVCAGPWTAKLLPRLGAHLTPVLTPVTYWRDLTGAHSVDRGFPILFNARLTSVYGLPSLEYPGLVKVLFHGGSEVDPDSADTSRVEPYVRKVADYVKAYLPELDPRAPARQESCFYTMTPDGQPILDRSTDDVVVGAGFSGSGFKHSPATGRMLAALALARERELAGGFATNRYGLDRLEGRGTSGG